MTTHDGWTVSAAAGAPKMQDRIHVIADERQWRIRPDGGAMPFSNARVTATRWRAPKAREVSTKTPSDCHVIGIALRNIDECLSVSGRIVRNGVAVPGTLLVTGPGVVARCLFKGPSDALHLHVPNELLAEYACGLARGRNATFFSESAPTRDPVIEQLGRALLCAEDFGNPFGQLYADCIGGAIVARLLGWATRLALADRPRVSELVRWRLKRAIDYVEAHLAEPVSLADVAYAAGLTRMHFAAQFRAATGLRPHEYLLRRRVERAQEMLAGSHVSVVDVALSVGFQTQSHFTSVFKTYVGQPPHAWRSAQHGTAISCGSEMAVRPGKTDRLMSA